MALAITILIIIALGIIGFVVVLKRHEELRERKEFVAEYRGKFIEFAESCLRDEIDRALLGWLVHRSAKLQREMGAWGVLAYKLPFTSKYIPDYQLIPNVLARVPTDTVHNAEYSVCDQMLLSYLGVLDDLIEERSNDARRPLRWFSIGVRVVLASPLYALAECGVIASRVTLRFTDSRIVKLASGVLTIFGIPASIAGSIIGWQEMIDWIKSFF